MKNITVTAPLLQMYLSPTSEKESSRIFQKVKAENDFRCDVVMGVAVLQLYPVQENRTGPQVVDLLTKRIMNQGANWLAFS